MKIELTTNLIQQNQFSTYNGYGDPDYIFNTDDIDKDIWSYWKNDLFMGDWGICVYKWLENQLKEVSQLINYHIKTNYICTHSPKWYNYSSDEVYFDLVGNWQLFKKSILTYLRTNDLIDEFDSYLVINYSSYSGFISFGTNNYEDWLKKFNEQSDIEVGAIIAFLIDAVVDTDSYNYVFEELSIDKYIDWTNLEQNKLNKTI